MKKIKVLLVNPPTVAEIPEFARGISYYSWLKTKNKFCDFVPGELLGAQCIQKYVREHNLDCEFEILNACVEEHVSVEQTLEVILKKMPLDLVCLTGPYDVFSEILYIAEKIKQYNSNIKILYGQFFASLCYNEILEKYSVFDYLSVGYGEVTVSKLIDYLQNKCKIDEIPGLAYKMEDDVIYRKQEWCNVSEIIKIKPTRENVQKVLNSGLNISIFCSRGCPYRCSFCATGSLMGREHKYFLRDPYDVVDELEELYNKYHIKRITFVDDTFAPNTSAGKEQARIIAEEIIKRNIKLEIMVDSRIDCIDRELFTLLYRAGVRYVYIGIEAASDENLKEYNKGYKANKIKDSLEILSEIGIKAVYGFINFNPETTFEDLLSNIELLSNLKYTDPTMYSHEYIPYPGTDMTKRLIKEGLVVGSFPNYRIIYKEPKIQTIKNVYDKLLAIYTTFVFNMNKYPEFYISNHEQIYNNINKMFASYIREVVLALMHDDDTECIYKRYRYILKDLLKKILIEERKREML